MVELFEQMLCDFVINRIVLNFCLFVNRYIYYNLLHHRHAHCCEKQLTLSCPLVDILLITYANIKGTWKYVGCDGHIVLNRRIYFHT